MGFPEQGCHVRLRFTDFHPAVPFHQLKPLSCFLEQVEGSYFLLSHLLGPVLADIPPKN